MQRYLADETQTVAFGQQLYQLCQQGGYVISLKGDLGAGKTTLVRGVLRGAGHVGAVKSPTYTLVEPYEFDHLCVYHFDLYRLADAEELEFIGIRDYPLMGAMWLVEWASRGEGFLPPIDIEVQLTYQQPGRLVELRGCSEKGQQLIQQLV